MGPVIEVCLFGFHSTLPTFNIANITWLCNAAMHRIMKVATLIMNLTKYMKLVMSQLSKHRQFSDPFRVEDKSSDMISASLKRVDFDSTVVYKSVRVRDRGSGSICIYVF